MSEDWIGRWKDGRIGWHRMGENPLLARWWKALGVAAGARVLVPLAGASDDLTALLARGYRVDAVELADQAIQRYFADRQLTPERRQIDGHTAWCAGRLRFFQADWFALDPELLGAYQAVYDRAALIAIPPHDQRRYAQHLGGFCAPHSQVLLITLEYPAWLRPGPPYSVTGERVQALFGEHFQITCLGRHPENDLPQVESVYRLDRR